MKRLTLFFIMLFTAAALAYNPPQIAVYVTGDLHDKDKRVFGARLLTAIANTGHYTGIERPGEFFAEAERKRTAEQGGAINDAQISELGRHFGVAYVCIANLTHLDDTYKINVRIVNAKTAETVYAGEAASPLETAEELVAVLETMVENMFGGHAAQTPAESEQTELAEEQDEDAGQEPPEPVKTVTPETPPPPVPEPKQTPEPAAPTPAAPGKQTIAVYMAGNEPRGAKGVHNILGGELARTISTSDKYLAVDRTDAILEQLAKEHVYQRSGAVSDDQIKSLGQQLGAQFLCISDIHTVGPQSYYLDVRLVDVVSAEIVRTVTANNSLKNAEEMTKVARTIAYELIETEKAAKARKRKKAILLTTSISLDVLGLGAIAYGLLENSNIKTHVDNYDYTSAKSAQTKRNAAYIAGGALLASGITIHIFF